MSDYLENVLGKIEEQAHPARTCYCEFHRVFSNTKHLTENVTHYINGDKTALDNTDEQQQAIKDIIDHVQSGLKSNYVHCQPLSKTKSPFISDGDGYTYDIITFTEPELGTFFNVSVSGINSSKYHTLTIASPHITDRNKIAPNVKAALQPVLGAHGEQIQLNIYTMFAHVIRKPIIVKHMGDVQDPTHATLLTPYHNNLHDALPLSYVCNPYDGIVSDLAMPGTSLMSDIRRESKLALSTGFIITSEIIYPRHVYDKLHPKFKSVWTEIKESRREKEAKKPLASTKGT